MFVARGQLHHACGDAAAQGKLRLFVGAATADRNHGIEQADETQPRQDRSEFRRAGQAGRLQQLPPASGIPALQLVGDITCRGSASRKPEQIQLHATQGLPPTRGQFCKRSRQQHLQRTLHLCADAAGTDAEGQADQIIIGIIAVPTPST